MATPLGRLPVWMRQSTLVPAVFRMLSLPVAGSRLARNTWFPPRLTIRNVSPARLASMATMVVAKRPVEAGGRRGGLHVDLLVEILGLHLYQGTRVDSVDESLHVRSFINSLRRRCST